MNSKSFIDWVKCTSRFFTSPPSRWLCRCKHASYHSSTSGQRPCDRWQLSPWKHLKNRYENVTWGELCNDKLDLAPDAVYLLRWANRSLPALKTNISVLFIEQEKRFQRKWFDHLFEKAEQTCVLYINIKALMFYLFSCVCNWNKIIFTIMLLHPHIVICYHSVRYLSHTFSSECHMCHKTTASSKCLSPFMCAQHLHSAQRSLLTASQNCQQVIHLDSSNIQKTHIHIK